MLDSAVVRLDRRQIESLRSVEPGLVREVVGVFLSNVGAELASLRAATRASNAADVWRIAHKLKGSCALLGVVRMTTVLQGVEACGRGGKLESAGSAVEQLDQELALVRPALEAELRS